MSATSLRAQAKDSGRSLRTVRHFWESSHADARTGQPRLDREEWRCELCVASSGGGHVLDEPYYALADAALRFGENFLGADIAAEGLKALGALLEETGEGHGGPEMVRQRMADLTHLHALAYARLGSTGKAQELLAEGSLTLTPGHADIAGLRGRLCKDLAFSAAPDSALRRENLERSHAFYHEGYLKAAKPSERRFLGVNAAATALWLGREEMARRLAGEVLELCQIEPDEWMIPTQAEAYLIRGDLPGAMAGYAAVRRSAEGERRWGNLATTRLQARRLCVALGQSEEPLETAFRFPRLAVFSGHMVDETDRDNPRFPDTPEMRDEVSRAIRARLDALAENGRPVGFAVCSAACGSDILFIRELLGQQPCPAEVHLVLPWGEEDFLTWSVCRGPKPDDWKKQFDEVKAKAASVTFLTQRTRPSGTGLTLDYCSECIIGLALQRAGSLGTEVVPMAVWNGVSQGDGPGGTASFIGYCRDHLRLPVEEIPLLQESVHSHGGGRDGRSRSLAAARREINIAQGQPAIKTMLFADVVGYSQITEAQTANFAPVFLGAVSELIAVVGLERPILSNTWGDALYMVFDEPEHAGRFALRLAKLIKEERPWQKDGLLPEDLSVRIGLHTGPVLLCVDPVIRQMTFTGNHVSHAARIEPVVARGEVYASEAFVAYAEIARRRLTADKRLGFGCDYLGQKDFAKKYGRYPLFRLRVE